MDNPFNNLPSYVRESPKFSKFLELVNAYIISGAVEVAQLKESFLAENKSTFVIQSLASQLGVAVDIPFVNGVPDWETYYARLYMAYRARSFVVSFGGAAIDFITGDPIKDKASVAVLDFSVAKGKQKKPMSVVYSVLSMNNNLTLDIVRDYLIPRVTGVGSNLYYLQFGQEVFGYDRDEVLGIRVGPDHVSTVDITDIQYVATGASIQSLGSGYAVNDVVKTATGVEMQITTLDEGAQLTILNASMIYNSNPSGNALAVSGGSGTGMTVNVLASNSKGYFIRGFDNGSFIAITSGVRES